ncbi:MAG: DUF4145 domain-containing protein [Flavobacteriales bacterium]|nr:DUF4145 domain-containing protein [Flavobacteriales bacterium]
MYSCRRCGGVVTAFASSQPTGNQVDGIFPGRQELSGDIPERAKNFLQQAIDSKAAPSGCVMLCASAVDAMLKAKNYVEGNLYSRIDKAVLENVITPDMAQWAHDVRLDANDERHADHAAKMPTLDDAERVVDFAEALAEILFVLPARVRRAIAPKQPEEVVTA